MNRRSICYVLVFALLGATLVLSGCANKQQAGAMIGAGAGALAGHQFGSGRGQTAMTIVGAIAGAMAGGAIGHRMDQKDRQKAAYALENNRSGQTSAWTNPDTGQHYSVTPTKTSTQNGHPCRTFVFKTRDANGNPKSVTRVACRNANGEWEVQE